MGHLELRVLGPLEAVHNGEPLVLGGPKPRAVLGVLLLRPRHVVRTDALVEALWGEQPPATAVKTLQKYVSLLRTQLCERDVLVTRGHGYALTIAPQAVDAGRFEHLIDAAGAGDPWRAEVLLNEALELWRGVPFVELGEVPAAVAERVRLEERRLEATEALADAQLALGQHARLVSRLEELVIMHPLRERLWGQLMLALYRCGRQADALDTYQRLRAGHAEQLGIDPSLPLRRLEERILRQDPDLDPPGQRVDPQLVKWESELAEPAVHVPELPEPPTSFVGRRQEMTELRGLLRRTRVLTLIGPAGVGKTRLALRLAAESAGDFPEGARIADFTAVDAGGSVVETVARALGVSDQPQQTTAETLRRVAAHSACLLVADNCEHVIDDAAACVADLLAAGTVRIVATSREPLGVPGEVTFTVEPLTVPDSDLPVRPDGLGTFDAVRLFIDRAASVSPGFELCDDNAADLAELCRRLDGLPLALELAAARVRAFALPQILVHLDRRFDLLTAGARTAPARHRTLAAAIDLSHASLTDAERMLYERLSVFHATFDYDAVEAVCTLPPLDRSAIVAAFPRLVDKSLVSVQRVGGLMRYRLLESLRVYSEQRLTDAAQTALRTRHAVHYLAVARAAAPDLRGAQQQAALARLTVEHPNLRAALAYSIDTASVTLSVDLISALALFWDHTGYRHEAMDSIRRVFDADPLPASPATVSALCDASSLLQSFDLDHAHRLAMMASQMGCTFGEHEQAQASLALGYTLAYLGRADEAIAQLRHAVAHFNEETHPWERGTAFEGLLLATPSLDHAIADAEDGARLFRRAGDRYRLANMLYCMANRALIAGERLDEAQSWLEESLHLSHETGSKHDRVHALLGLARLAWRRGHEARVETLIDECLPVLRRLGDQRCIGRALFVLGDLARQRGDSAAATELLRSSIQAAEPVADRVTLDSARRSLADMVP
jgi:predicted ATPase/DNA-binding SARP family transcriptional activator